MESTNDINLHGIPFVLGGFEKQVRIDIAQNGKPSLCLLLCTNGIGRLVFNTSLLSLLTQWANRINQELDEILPPGTTVTGPEGIDFTRLLRLALKGVMIQVQSDSLPGANDINSTYFYQVTLGLSRKYVLLIYPPPNCYFSFDGTPLPFHAALKIITLTNEQTCDVALGQQYAFIQSILG